MWANTDFFHLEVRKLNKKKFELQFDAKMELSDIRKQLGVLSASLDKLEIPANMTKNLEKALKKTLDQLAEFETRSERGIESLADAKKLEKAWSQITDSLDSIGAVLKSIDSSGLFPKEVKKNIEDAEKALAGYIQKLEQAKKTQAYQVEEKKRDDSLKDERAAQELLDKAKKKQMGAEAEFEAKKSSWSEEAQKRYSAEQAEIEDINSKLKDQLTIITQLEKKKDKLVSEGYMTKSGEVSAKAREGVKKGTGDEKKLKSAEDVAKKLKTAAGVKKDYEGMLKSAKGQAKGFESLKKEYEDAERAVQETKEAVEQLTVKLQEAENNTKQFEQNMENIAQGEAASAWAELVKLLEKITGLDLSGTAGDIDSIRKALQDYKQEELDKAPEAVRELKEELEETKKPAGDVRKGLLEVASASEDMERAADEVTRLKQQILDFFSVSNAIDIFKRALSSAFDTVKELDAVMTEAAVVTDFSIGDMWDQMPQYSKNASELGAATKNLYAATTLYYQQGLKGNDVMRVGVETMKMAKIANMDATEATTAMTAALRGFNMEVDELNAQKVNDVYSKLAAITAADTSQIATAMGKTASIAASANMEFETTAAFLAQIIETTQEAPETAGTALKTIVARFSEVKELQSQGLMSGVDSEGEAIDINKISTALRSVGISMDAFFAGQEGLDDVLMRLSQKWDTLDFTTQRYIATTAAGSRQQSRFIAMMSDYGRTVELVNEANNSAGASQQQYEKTLDSLNSKLAQLSNAWDQFTMGLANNEALKFGVDFLTKILETINKVTDAISGGSGLIKSLTSLMTVIGALKLGGKVLGKNSGTGGLLGKISGVVKNDSKQEYKRGVKDGKSYGEGWRAGLKEATQNIPAPEFSTSSDGNGPEDMTEKLNKVSVAAIGVGVAFGALSALFESSGIDEAAKATGELAKTFTVMGTIVPIVGKAVQLAGLEGMAAWSWALGASAAIAILAVGISHALEASKKKTLEYRLEQAEKATEETKKAAEEAKAAYENLFETKTGYNNLQEALDGLIEGTREWKAALIDANQQVLELIEKYPELASMEGAISYEGGRLAVSEDAWEEITNIALARSQSAQAAYIGASVSQTALQLEQKFSEMAKASNGGFGTNEIKKLYSLATITNAEKRQEEINKELEKLNNERLRLQAQGAQGGYVGDASLAMAGLIQKKMDFLSEDLDRFANEYAQKMEVYTSQLENYTKALMIYTEEQTQESSAYDKIVDALSINKGSSTYDRLKQEQDRIMAQGENEIRKQYFLLTGQEAATDVNEADLARDIAINNLSKELSENADLIIKLLSGKQLYNQNVLASAISGNTSSLTMSELSDLEKLDWEELLRSFGYDPKDQGSARDFYELTGLTEEAFAENQQIYAQTYSNLVESIGRGAYLGNSDFLQGLTVESLEKLGKQVSSNNLNSQQADLLIKTFEQVLTSTGLTSKDRLELENTFSITNWNDSMSRLNAMDAMFAKGIDQQIIVDYWLAATAGVEEYIDSEEEALQLASRMQEKVKDMTELSSRLSSGTATADDLTMLEKIGVDTSEYALTAEGWKATTEQTEEAITKLQEYYLMQAQLEKQRLVIDLGLGENSEEVKNVQKIIDMLRQPITTTYNVKTHVDLLDRIKEAVIFDRQKEIDKLSEINDTISDSNARIVSAIRESVESYRRQRENEKTEESIAQKQARLAYLRMDTSGANAMEIKRLEDELAQEQESYTDKLIDEKISELERQNDAAQEQRATQIELMKLQLEQQEESSAFWNYIGKLFEEGYDKNTKTLNEDSELVRLLQQAEGYSALSSVEQKEWRQSLTEAFKESVNVDLIDELDLNLTLSISLSEDSYTSLPVHGAGGNKTFRQVAAFSTGGLADFTGPAWLDGSKTNPEYVLNAQQTERFFELVDVLSSLKSNSSGTTQNSRENNFDIDINVESIGSDYDVEQVAIKVKDFIVNSSRYRNNNIL